MRAAYKILPLFPSSDFILHKNICPALSHVKRIDQPENRQGHARKHLNILPLLVARAEKVIEWR
jgi:hypothetical protein